MTGSSPATRPWSSPSRSRISDLFAENRHTELNHHDALAAAQAEHERVRHTAIQVFKAHELKEECRRLQQAEEIVRQHQRREEERIRNEERLRAEEERLRALKLKTVPKLPPEAPPLAPSSPSTPRLNGFGPSNPIPAASSANKQGLAFPTQKEPSGAFHQPVSNAAALLGNGTKPMLPISTQPPQLGHHNTATKTPPSAALTVNGLLSGNSVPQQIAPLAPSTPKPSVDRYVVIHQNLKKLRAFLVEQAKSLPPLKARMGDMRRELRKSLGQMVTEKGGNKQQTAAILGLLQESLNGSIPSAMIDPSQFVTDQQRGPMEGALHNEAQLPSLFLYLLNIFAKTIINQFINECGAQPKAADPLGVITAQIFSNKAYLWRGKTLIDILMAKYRVACPVLFGYRGSETTEQGRIRLGWRKEGAGWTPEQQHTDKMKGLAVGYAAISLRDFSRSPHTNPWPPSKYWTSLARIVNTPPAEISNTQCVVLRGMIEIYEERFISFYGNAAIAALRSALIDFPNKAQIKTPGTAGLPVLAHILKRDIGLEL